MMSKCINNIFEKPVSISDSINTTATEYDACIAPDESFIIFTSIGRKDGMGSGDLYISFKEDGKWTPGKNPGANINSPFMDQCPSISPDGKYLFFTSFRDNDGYKFKKNISTNDYYNLLQSPLNGSGNIFWMDSRTILQR